MFYRFLTVTLLLLVVLIGCSNESPSNGNTSAVDTTGRPDSEVSGARINLYDGGRVTTEIVAEKITQFEAQDSTMAYNLDIQSYDSLGQLNSVITGDSALIREQTGLFVIYGHVVVATADSTQLETELLHWNPKTDRIYTDAFVRIIRPDAIARGWGFEADQRIKSYKILHRVSGEADTYEKP
ncbi:MAG: LPS export ABC transporter periplasmic protein LptC [candidate division Zixibacteria bacterium]|nr:LPS export ABC transporter periplasmic protein LptC [candidate division Zixibacteria bacterium]